MSSTDCALGDALVSDVPAKKSTWKKNTIGSRTADRSALILPGKLALFLLIHLFLAFLFVDPFCYAETEVEGEVSGVWDVEGSPYLVLDTLIVPEGDTLLIEPGVEVIFQEQTANNRTIVYVDGTLEANGTENDSIYFLTDGAAFQGLMSDHTGNGRIVLNYCVMDSVMIAIDEGVQPVAMRHCRIMALNAILFDDHHTADLDTLEYNTFQQSPSAIVSHIYIDMYHGVLRFNHGPDVWADFDPRINQVLPAIEGNTFFLFRTFGGNDLVVEDNTFAACDAWGGTTTWRNNDAGQCEISDGAHLLEGNTFVVLELYETQATVRNNRFYFRTGAHYAYPTCGIEADACDTLRITGNLVSGYEVGIFVDCCVLEEIVNNTVHFRELGLHLDGVPNVENRVANNILLGDGINCTGIRFLNGFEPDVVGYNCIYNVTTYADGLTLDETNLLENPYLAGGDPFDYHLQANSPCIDAADPDTPDDPDGTPADIGCYFYDQSVDNPPVLTTPPLVFAQTGQPLSIEITATDDNGLLSFTFPDLPEWLSEEGDELDWVGDTTVVSGTVPDSAEDITFTVIVEDGPGQTDTAEVFVDVDQRTLLSGEISGTLHAQDSPFFVIDDIVVPEGDSLVIEPGCDLQFRGFHEDESIVQLVCYGKLVAMGNPADSILFRAAPLENRSNFWFGIELYGIQDTTQLGYCTVENSEMGIRIWQDVPVSIIHSRFYHTPEVAIRCAPGSSLLMDSCAIVQEDPSYYSLKVITASAVVTNTSFAYHYEPPWDYPVIHFYVHESSSVVFSDCTFEGGFRTNIVSNSTADISRCTFRDMRHGVIISTGSTARVTNCLFERIGRQEYGEAAVNTWRLATEITNNVFHNCRVGVQYYASPSDTLPVIYNNLFLNNNVGVYAEIDSSQSPLTEYNSFYGNDTLTWQCEIGDSNLFTDPLIDDTLNYYLYDNSPLIDAGHPHASYNDLDSTRNDIGLWGGPNGLSYDYPLTVRDSEIIIPSVFEIRTVYPNPFNSRQQISFALPRQGSVKLSLYNILGQPVFTIDWPQLQPGVHRKSYNASGLASGVYFVQLKSGKEVRTTRVLLVK